MNAAARYLRDRATSYDRDAAELARLSMPEDAQWYRSIRDELNRCALAVDELVSP